MYVQGVQHVAGGAGAGALPNTGDSWLLLAAGIVTAIAGAVVVVTTIAFIIAKSKKAHKA